MSKSNSENVQDWRQRTKQKTVQALGGSCEICGYNKAIQALEFHHTDPNNKERTIANMLKNAHSIKAIIEELEKCVLLCANCHREVEYGIAKIPAERRKIDLSFFISLCPICNSPIYEIRRRTCSKKCLRELQRKNTRSWWDAMKAKRKFTDKQAIKAYNISNNNLSAAGRCLGVSDNAIRKRLKKIGVLI